MPPGECWAGTSRIHRRAAGSRATPSWPSWPAPAPRTRRTPSPGGEDAAPVPGHVRGPAHPGRRRADTGIRTAVQDITDRTQAEDPGPADLGEQLARLVGQLEEKNRQNTILSELRGFLVACSCGDEIGPVAARAMARLFPDSSGALMLLSPSKTISSRPGGARRSASTRISSRRTPAGGCAARPRCGRRADGPRLPQCRELRGTSRYGCLPLRQERGEVLGMPTRAPGGCGRGQGASPRAGNWPPRLPNPHCESGTCGSGRRSANQASADGTRAAAREEIYSGERRVSRSRSRRRFLQSFNDLHGRSTTGMLVHQPGEHLQVAP